MRLNDWRDRQKMNQSEFGARIGTTGASVSRIESGAQWPSAELLLAIERETAGEVTVTDILAAYQDRKSSDNDRDDSSDGNSGAPAAGAAAQ